MAYFIIGGDGKEYGPKPDSEVREWIAEGRLNAQSQIRRQSDANWTVLGDLPEFANDLFGATPQKQVIPTPSAPAIQQYQQPYPQYSAQAQSGTNGMAIAGMVMGILSLVTICCYGFPFNLLGIIFSAIGLSQIKKSNPRQSGKGMAIAGLICSILSFLIYAALLVVVIASEM